MQVKKKNCEEDDSILNNNLKEFLIKNLEEKQQPQPTHELADTSVEQLEKMLSDAAETVEEATPESQACAYVSGFIFKKLRHNKCQDCQKAFLSDEQEAIHIFTSLREYNENNCLQYVNKSVVTSVEQCATIINNYLNHHGWEQKLKTNIMILLIHRKIAKNPSKEMWRVINDEISPNRRRRYRQSNQNQEN